MLHTMQLNDKMTFLMSLPLSRTQYLSRSHSMFGTLDLSAVTYMPMLFSPNPCCIIVFVLVPYTGSFDPKRSTRNYSGRAVFRSSIPTWGRVICFGIGTLIMLNVSTRES